jgi:hypothetical protein
VLELVCEPHSFRFPRIPGLESWNGLESLRICSVGPLVTSMVRGWTLLIVLLAAWPLGAHHSQAAHFDTTKPVTLRGVVTQVEWINPHAWLHLEVKDAGGNVVPWRVEIASPNILKRAGVTKDSFMHGETTVEVWLPKDRSRLPNLADGREGETLTLPSGQKVTLPFWSASGKAILFGPGSAKK